MTDSGGVLFKVLPFIDFTKYCSPGVDIDGQITLRFVNLTQKSIMLLWHSFTGEIKKYNTLPMGHSITMNTFVGHIWSFVDERTGDHVMDNENNYYFTVQPNSNENSDSCQVIKIKSPLLNLKELCYQCIRNELVFNDNQGIYEELNCLPRIIHDELRHILIKGFTYKHTPLIDSDMSNDNV